MRSRSRYAYPSFTSPPDYLIPSVLRRSYSMNIESIAASNASPMKMPSIAGTDFFAIALPPSVKIVAFMYPKLVIIPLTREGLAGWVSSTEKEYEVGMMGIMKAPVKKVVIRQSQKLRFMVKTKATNNTVVIMQMTLKAKRYFLVRSRKPPVRIEQVAPERITTTPSSPI